MTTNRTSAVAPAQKGKPVAQTPSGDNYPERELAELRAICAEVQRIRACARQELELARQMRADAERYRRETETKVRSEAQRLALQTRLALRKEIAELKRQAGEEIQRILADIRLIRIAAQKELETQQRLNSASRITALSAPKKRTKKETRKEKEAVT